MARRFDHLGDVEAFVTVVEQGSFTSGAITLSTTASVLSRAITRLEVRLGTQLLRRTTRHLNLTEAGHDYLEQARAAFSLIDDAERAMRGREGTLTGRVRLSVSTTYGHFRLPEKLARFAVAHPHVKVEVNIANRNVDLVAEGYDIAIRAGELPDSGLIGRKLEDATLQLVASPSYLKRRGVPQDIDDLVRHACLPFIMPSTGKPAPWLFSVEGKNLDWVPEGDIQVFDDVLGVVSLAEAGAGICQAYDFVVRDRLERGRLVTVMPKVAGRSRAFSLLYPPHRNLPIAIRALIDFLVE
ncbi:LuxR family transcriptional regulator [Mesorhizobium loti]|nr:LysR family transcriptional regulator [Mesorhizobium loti]PLP58388.1 LuxR family transcriptional regulator [Mesorhizobium loti]